MKDETTTATTVRFDIPGMFVYEERVSGEVYHHLELPRWATSTEVGKPALPVLGAMIEVPFDVRFQPEIVLAETTSLEGYNVYPAQPPRMDSPSPVEAPPFTIDRTTYLADSDYPAEPVVVRDEDAKVIRGHRILFLKVNPFSYNPVSRTLGVYTTIEVRLHYDRRAQIEAVDRRIASQAFEELLAASVLNYKDPRRFTLKESRGDTEAGCDYLIVTPKAFYNEKDTTNPIMKLAAWKRRKGYRTWVVTIEKITNGNTGACIRQFIQDAYGQWSPAPSYVLLVGDSDLVPTVLGLHHPYEDMVPIQQPQVETDLYYGTVDGDDYFPDIFIGRIPVDSVAQLTDVVDKILTYEQEPPATPAHTDYYKDVSLVGMFADEVPVDGREGRPWIANQETIRQYLASRNYDVERIYTTDSGFPTSTNQAPTKYQDGTPLPSDLQQPNYAWDGDTATISRALNEGRFLVNYRAHGDPDGWNHPAFHNGDLTSLQQDWLTPVVFSITCQTGWFDNETDDDTHGGRPAGSESFVEAMLRRPRAGAAAVMAMSRVSYTGWNDLIDFGFVKAIWPDFAPDPPWSGAPTIPAYEGVSLLRMGQILNFGKMFMANAYGEDNMRKLEFEMGHLFGDPEMPIWTQAPSRLAVSHPNAIGSVGIQEFVVCVTDAGSGVGVGSATVVLTRKSAIIAQQQTRSDGVAYFKLNSVGSGDLDLTVTARNFRPYMGVITVSTAVLNRVEPPDGSIGETIHVGGQGFQGGENVELYFGDQLYPTAVTADASGSFGQGTTTVDINVPANYPDGLVNITAHGVASDRSAVRVFQVHKPETVDLWTYDQQDPSTWSLHPGDNPTWDSPDIVLYDRNGQQVASNSLVLGETYTVDAVVHNNSTNVAHLAKVIFRWSPFGGGGPWQEFGTSRVDVPGTPPNRAHAQTLYTPTLTGHQCITAEIEHPQDISLGNNKGQENLDVGVSQSPTEVRFSLYNPTKELAPVHLEVRQLIPPGTKQREMLWATTIKHPDPQMLPPGEREEASLIVDPHGADVAVGTQAEFAVTAFIGREMIGGLNVVMTKQ